MDPSREATDEERQAILDAAKRMRDSIIYRAVLKPWTTTDPSDKKLRAVLHAVLTGYTEILSAIRDYESEDEDGY